MKHFIRCALLVAVGLSSAAFGQFHNTHAFLWTASGGMQDLGTIPGWQNSYAFGINRFGYIVGAVQNSTAQAAFIWTPAAGMHYLKGVSLSASTATAINDSGQVVGSTLVTNGESHAFVWSKQAGAQDLGTLGGPTSSAVAINNSGEVVGYSYTAAGTRRAFLWTQSTGMQDLMEISVKGCPSCESLASGVNPVGVIVGSLGGGKGLVSWPIIWRNGRWRNLGDLGGEGRNRGGSAAAINQPDQVVGSAAAPEGQLHAFLWTLTEGIQDIGLLPGAVFSAASAVNNLGQVVGVSQLSTLDDHAFVWNSGSGMQDLGTLGGPNSQASGINDSGQIVGESDVP